ncbi:Uncharacterised protein (plasmid) [Tsukamurella tyrosinosolvens]|uniref:Uncharacterized protein n=1 Tax=Tsukamurella tyrosinosolvens TaxID=57704 RepID=A0A1H4UEZ5_TSUTY|nr:hypothetical protein [Tsukamurella tyrosinosolvens]KXO92938.1 hypothetical protein AXK58_13795 [Tsukamurella tyrosinosolvens]SEC67309.1 hypothetical protein SAMN04489793_2879 [Tsukamurella tyrosinosolvens]VEH94179.1 Uncharacterised protein [Tsukamurella tyrosinosolvens]
MALTDHLLDYLVRIDEKLDRFRDGGDPEPFRIVHVIAVRDVADASHVALIGADPQDVELARAQAEQTYPTDRYIHAVTTQPISRAVADTWADRPADDAPVQEWAEFLFR